VRQAPQVRLVIQVQQAQLEHKVKLVQLARQALQAMSVQLVQLEYKVILVLQDHKETLVQQVRKVIKV
jgi:hypothetical protein